MALILSAHLCGAGQVLHLGLDFSSLLVYFLLEKGADILVVIPYELIRFTY